MARRSALNRRIDAALGQLEPRIRRAFAEAMQKAAGAVDQGALIAALEVGDIGRAAQLLRIDDAILFPLGETIRESYLAGGTMVEQALPRGLSASFGFNGRHTRAEAWVRENVGTLVEGIQEETLQMTRDVVRDGIERGVGPRRVAMDITGRRVGNQRVGGFLGLNSQQANSIIAGRAKLASGNPTLMREYLNLKLRDRRFDGTVKKAIREGRPITGAQLDKIIDGHKAKALRYRGEVIARTESINALRAGRHEGFAQLVESGKVEAQQVTRVWDSTGDSRTRPDHRAMDGQTVQGMDEPFSAPDGSRLMHPGDTSLGAGGAQTVMCRCIEKVRVDYLGAGNG